MASLIFIVGDHLRRLASFRGRESRGYFWPYAGIVIALSVIGIFVAMSGPMNETMQQMQEYASTHPDQVTIGPAPGQFSISLEGHHPEFFADFVRMMRGMDVVLVITVALLAAAVARRLHDRGRTGLWGLMPLPFLAFGSIVMPQVMASVTPDMGLFFLMFFNNMIYIVSLVVLVVMLAGAGQPTPNKYGDLPS